MVLSNTAATDRHQDMWADALRAVQGSGLNRMPTRSLETLCSPLPSRHA